MKKLVGLVGLSTILLVSACSSSGSAQGGVGMGSPIPKEPMPGSPAAEMQGGGGAPPQAPPQ